MYCRYLSCWYNSISGVFCLNLNLEKLEVEIRIQIASSYDETIIIIVKTNSCYSEAEVIETLIVMEEIIVIKASIFTETIIVIVIPL